MADNNECENYFSLKMNKIEDIDCSIVAQDIIVNKITLVKIVERLGDLLTDRDKNQRLRGVSYLSSLLESLPASQLNTKEISFLVTFYCDRLKDHHSILPSVLDGLLSLEKMTNLDGEEAVKILQALFQHVTCQSQAVPDRLKVYTIVFNLSLTHSESVSKMGMNFIFGLLSTIEGEIDPKNLNVIFSFLPNIFKIYKLGHLEEEAFEVCSRYFPVDFNPAAKENVFVTRDGLARGLESCLSATPGLSALSLPLLTEKLDSNLRIAKLDSYSLLIKCCLRLKVEDLEPQLMLLWKLIQRDTLPVGNPEIADAALKALSSVTLVITHPDNIIILKRFVDDILASVRSLLSKFDDNLFLPSMKILEAVSVSSYAVNYIFPLFNALCDPYPQKTRDALILMSALKPFLKLTQYVSEPVFKLFLTSADDLLCEDICILGFSGLQDILCHERPIESHWKSVTQVILKELLNTNEKSRKQCSQLLRILSTITPSLVLNDILKEVTNDNQYTFRCRLHVISAIGDLNEILDEDPNLIPTLLSYCRNKETSEESLQCLLCLCQSGRNKEFCQLLHVCYNAIDCLWDCDQTEAFCQVIEIIMRNLKSEEQKNVLQTFAKNPLTFDTNKQNVHLLESLLGSLRPNVEIPDIDIISKNLLVLINKKEISSAASVSVYRILGTFINKYEESFATTLISQIFENPVKNIDLLCWSLKGALLRGLPNLQKYLDIFFTLLNDKSVGLQIAESVQVLLRQEQIFLNSASHCTVRLLYKQRVFEYFPKLVNNICLFPEAYITALVNMVKDVPMQLIINEKNAFSAFLRHALNPPYNPLVLFSTLSITVEFLKEKSSLLIDQIPDILPAFLAIAKNESMKVRICALQCIFYIAYFPTHILLPFKQQVVRELLPFLDDKKRLVRREAVRARSRWCLVGAVGEDDIFT